MPDNLFTILVYAAILFAAAIAIKVALRWRADRRRHDPPFGQPGCKECDGRNGHHAPGCGVRS